MSRFTLFSAIDRTTPDAVARWNQLCAKYDPTAAEDVDAVRFEWVNDDDILDTISDVRRALRLYRSYTLIVERGDTRVHIESNHDLPPALRDLDGLKYGGTSKLQKLLDELENNVRRHRD